MTPIPAKPINELEKKTGVTDQDSILILDGETGEAKLADKEELRGIGIANIEKSKSGKTTTLTINTTDGQNYKVQLEDGADGNDGDDGLTPQFSLEGGIFKRKFPNESEWKTLFNIEDLKGEKGEKGISITSITKSKSGRTTTITINKSDNTSKSFEIQDGIGIESITPTREGKTTKVVIRTTDGGSQNFSITDGTDGEDGNDGENGKNPEFQFSETHLQQRLEGEEEWKNLIPLSVIRGGTITNIARTSGDGSPGTTDTYTVTLSDGFTQTFQVYNGRDGQGSGDMLKSNNLSDLIDKAQARTNLEVYSRSESHNLFSPKLIEVSVATAYNTVAKVGTTSAGNYVPQQGDVLLVTFVNGCSVASPRLNIDGSGAKNIRAGYYNVSTNMLQLGSTANSNIKVMLWYDGAYYQMFGAGHNSTYGEISEAEVISPTSATARLLSGRRIAKMKEYFEQNVPNPTAPSHSANKQYVDEKLTKKADLVDNKIPASQLPSYVDDVLEFANREAFPATGEKGKIYIAINDDSQWRWTGTGYKKMVSSPGSTDAIPEGSQNLYFTNERAQAALTSALGGKADKNHSHTKVDVGLGNVDNTSDAEKNSATVMLTNKTISGDNNTITKVDSLKNLKDNSEVKLWAGNTADIPAPEAQQAGVIYFGFKA